MGAVYSALDTLSGTQVALKRLSQDAPPAARALFEREYSVLLSLRHPRIIEVYEYGLDAEGPFYTMELLEGTDLRELAPLPPTAACKYLRDVASSLALLHARRFLHRDLSPRNVRAHKDGRCKLIDFGALMSFGTSDQVVGTPPAIAPEALSGHALDQRTDLYALGALGYFLLTGRHAYPARSLQALPDAWANQLVPPSLYAPDLPNGLEVLILQLLSLEAMNRPSSAAEVIDRLNGIAGLEPDSDGRVARAYFRGAQLIERGRELARADRAISRVKQARGRNWILEARAGVGKTRLLGEIALRAQLAGLLVLRADAAEHSGGLATARALLLQLLRLHPQLGQPLLSGHAPQLHTVWPELFEGRAPATQPPSEEALARLPALIVDRLLALTQAAPVLLAIDNVPQSDVHSAAVFMALARRARSAKLWIVATARLPRAEQTPALRGLYQAASAVTLHGLSADGTEALVRLAFGDIPNAQRTARRLHQAAHGNPQHSLELLERWVEDGLVQYVGGGFNLPLTIPPGALLTRDQVASERLSGCSEAARALAGTLAQLDEPVTFETCLAVAASLQNSRSVYAAAHELLGAEVLSQSAQGLRFHDKRMRALADSMLTDSERAQLLERVARHMLETRDGSFEREARAGLALVRAGQRERGARLIATAARTAVADDITFSRLAAHADALEAALSIYRETGRSQLQQLDLLVPLVLASYEISQAFALCYGDAALSALEHALGLRALRASSGSASLEQLLQVLSSAPVLDADEQRTEATPDVLTLVGWLVRCVVSLVSVAAAAIDHEAQARFVESLRPFRVLGPENPAALVYDYCALLIALTEDRLAAAHRGWAEMLQRLQRVDSLPPNVLRVLRVGATFALGLLESQLDDDRALQRLKELEAFDTPRTNTMIAQLAFIYHGFRGEIDKSNECRERLEAHAVQYGSVWQMEVWASCTANAIYGNTRDVGGNKRTLAQLDRLRRQMPSLDPFWERAAGSQQYLAGAPASAITWFERTLARPGARERVGWGAVRGGLACAHNDLGHYARAREICEDTLRSCADDLEYVAMLLRPQVELCRALGGLGEHEAAQTELARLFERFSANNNCMTLGTLHGTAAELALRRGEILEFEHHLNMMDTYYDPTRNPALIAQSERLRNLHAGTLAGSCGAQPPAALSGSSLAAGPSTLLTTARGTVERKQRALELVASQTDATLAYLFARGLCDEPVLVSALGGHEPAPQLLESVRVMFEAIPEDSEETAIASASITTTAEPVQDHRLLPLTVVNDSKRMLIGAIAVCGSHKYRPVSHALLSELAQQLYRAGDLVRARTLG